MKKWTIILIIIIILVAVLTFMIINKNKDNSDTNPTNEYEQNVENEIKTFNFTTAYGEVTIEAENALSASGTAGASNYIFYLKDNKLYLYNHTGEDEVYANGVTKMYYNQNNPESILIELNEDSTLHKRNPYIEYK